MTKVYIVLCLLYPFALSFLDTPEPQKFLGCVSDMDGSSDSLENDSCDSSFSESNGSQTSLADDPDMQLIGIYSFSRNGVSKDFMLYDGEYDGYKMKQTQEDSGLQLTPLGKAQCWSVGRQLATQYSEFVTSALNTENYLMNYAKLDKAVKCINLIYYGMTNFVPKIGYFSEDYVQEAFDVHGNCFLCSDESKFPYSESQEVPSDTVNSDHNPTNVEMHPRNFIDLDDECKMVNKFASCEMESLPDSDMELIEEMLEDGGRYTGYSSTTILRTVHKHLYHKIPLENGLENMSETFMKRATANRDDQEPCYFGEILNVHENKWTSLAVYARPILQDVFEKLQQGKLGLHVYTLHGNNMIAVLAFLIGISTDFHDYVSLFGSMMELLIYLDTSDNQYYVELKVNGGILELRDCPGKCDLTQFVSNLSLDLVLGGDLKEFCATDQEQD